MMFYKSQFKVTGGLIVLAVMGLSTFVGGDAKASAVAQPNISTVPTVPTAQFWYYCEHPQGYYPYVPTCQEAWRPVPVTPPPPPPSSSTATPPVEKHTSDADAKKTIYIEWSNPAHKSKRKTDDTAPKSQGCK